jgi:hypothetical protein
MNTQPLTKQTAIEAAVFCSFVPGIVFSAIYFNPFLAIWIAFISLLHISVLALPIFLILNRYGWVNIFTSTLFGALIGGLPAALIFADTARKYLPFAGFGAASGLLFSLYVMWKNNYK